MKNKKKKGPPEGGLKGHVGHPDPQQPRSHEVLNSNTSVVTVGVNTESTKTLTRPSAKGLATKTITSLEPNLGNGRSSHRRHEPSGEEHKDSRTDQRHKVKNPYNQRRSTGYHYEDRYRRSGWPE